jgi:hypothetical protein
LLTAGVNYTGGKVSVIDIGGNFSACVIAKQCRDLGKDATAGVNNTSEKFAARINSTGGQFAAGAP